MKKKYYIALYLLGINNETLILIINNLNESDLKQLFNGNQIEISYKYNIDLNKYENILCDKKLLNKKLLQAEEILKKNKELNIKTITFNQKYYPHRLKEIEDPPAIIYIKGRNILKCDDKSIACIGTRNPTKYGINAINSIVTNLVKEKFTIISGLAYGVDYLSHRKCVELGGRTIAVVAHGLDIIYPKEHKSLENEIIKLGGTIISEYPVGTKVEKFRFVRRNRLVSALSHGVLMIEAKEKSGTRHTVDFAIKQNKKIFTPRYNRLSLESGLNKFIIDTKIGTSLNGTNDYVKILSLLNYKLINNKKLLNTIKSNKINSLLNLKSCTFNLNDIKEFDGKTAFNINKSDYIKFKNILKENNINIKEFFNGVIHNIINNSE